MNIKELTIPVRHLIVKILAPKVFRSAQYYEAAVKSTPRPSTLIAKAYFLKLRFLTCAEIGVFKGDNALSILNLLNVSRLYLIDPYVEYENIVGKTENSLRVAYSIAYNRLNRYPSVKWIKKNSDDAVNFIDRKLHFCYIDGDHSYKQVKRDLENYYPLVHEGGILAGHDYTLRFSGVIKAVNEFAEEKDLKCYVVFQDWIIFKP